MSKTDKLKFFIYIKDYFDRLRLELKSEETIKSYRFALNNFRKFLKEKHGKSVDKINFSFVSVDIVRDYLFWIVSEGGSLNTRNLRLMALKGYIGFCAEKNIELAPLEIKLSKVKIKAVLPKTSNWLSKEQVKLILEQPSQSKIGIRDRFIMLFLFSTGVRLSELLNIKTSDLHLNSDYPSVKVIGKGQKARRIPLPADLIDNLVHFQDLFDNDADDYIFSTTIKGVKDKMSPDNVQRICLKYGKSARKIDSTIPEKVTPHLFRHSYAAQMYRLGISLPELAKLLGHVDLNSIEIYAETDDAMVNKAISNIANKNHNNNWKRLSEDEKLKIMGLK